MRVPALGLVFVAAACSCAGRGDLLLAPPRDTVGAPVAMDHEHALWTALLSENVSAAGVDYGALAEESERFDRYLAMLHAVTPDELATWSEDQRFAFWINVYNAHIVRLVTANYPVDSIKDLGGTLVSRVWDKPVVPMPAHDPEGASDNLSFNEVEHLILRARFPDARLHAAINCASASCPPLLAEAFVATRLDSQLDQMMRGFIADESRNRLDRDANKLYLSKIFKWFEDDFKRDAGDVPSYVALFATPEQAGLDREWITEARISHLDYSWKLNDWQRDE